MATKCEIRYANDQAAVFYAGSTVIGYVELTLAKSKKILGLVLELKGHAKTRWVEGQFQPMNKNKFREGKKRRGAYTGEEVYYDKRVVLLQGTGVEQEIKAGTYKLPFTHDLDPKLPSSFEYCEGFIRYTAKVVLLRTWKDQKFRFGMTVLNHLDLNHELGMHQPVRYGATKRFKGTFMNRGAINFEAELPMTGFVPGQAIPIKVHIDNDSDVDIAQVSVKLKQIITLHFTWPTQKSRFARREVYVGWLKSVPQRTSKSFLTNVPIPSVPPSNRNLSKIIQFHYVLIIKPRLNYHSDEKLNMFITIGTIPFTDTIGMPTINQVSQPGCLPPIPSAPILEPSPFLRRNESLPSYDDVLREHPELASIDPPSYEASVLEGSYTENHDDGPANYEHLFRPLYPVYHFNVPSSSVQTSQNDKNNNGILGFK